MTPIDFARNLANGTEDDRALAVAMVARGLSDDDPSDPTRAPWPIDTALPAAARHLGIDPTPALILAARDMMPRVSDAMLNRHPRA
jgi:hypothetical protein